MLAACKSLLMAVMTLVNTKLNNRSASGSPGLVPVFVCTMFAEWLVENHVEFVTSVKSWSRCWFLLLWEMLCCCVRMLWRSCVVKSLVVSLLLCPGRKSRMTE